MKMFEKIKETSVTILKKTEKIANVIFSPVTKWIKKKNKSVPPTPKKKITLANMILVAVATILIILSSLFLGTVMDYSSSSDGEFDISYISTGLNLVIDHPKWILTSLKKENSYSRSVLLISLMGWGIFIVYKLSKETKRTHRKGSEYGSSKWGDKREKKSLNKDNETNLIAMKDSEGNLIFDDDGEIRTATEMKSLILSQDVSLSLTSWLNLNLNVLLIGSAGSGKTRYYGLPNLMTLSTSFVVTDPKGEILRASGKMLEQSGYKVRVLNLIEMEHSHNYNPFHYVYDYNGNVSEDGIKKMVDVLYKNTKGDGEKDDFWAKKGQTLLEAIVYLLFEESEYNAEFDENGNIKPETRDISNLNFFSVTEKMRKLQYPPKGSTAKKPDGFFMERLPNEPEEDFRQRQSEGFLCSLDKDFIELEKRKGDTLAGRLYKEVRNAPEETGQSFLTSANVKTFFFNLTNLSNLTCCDNIHLETIGDEKTALFLLIPATSRTYNFVAAMLYTQMFDVLNNRANFKFGGRLPVHVRCIMEEFYNIGEIPDFDVVIGYVRGMGISISIILQALAQLKSRYEKTWEIITGNCDSLLFLGGQEESSLKYLSESLGKETIDVHTLNRTKSAKSPSTSESNSIIGRELMLPNEISAMPQTDCIIKIKSHNPFYSEKYLLNKHPNYKYLSYEDENMTYLVSELRAVTLKELQTKYLKNNDDRKVDTSVNFVDAAQIEKDNDDGAERNKKMITVFSDNAVLKSADNIDLPVQHDYDSFDYDEAAIKNAIQSVSSGDEYIHSAKFGNLSDQLEKFELGEATKKKGEETDATNISLEKKKEFYSSNVDEKKDAVHVTKDNLYSAEIELCVNFDAIY